MAEVLRMVQSVADKEFVRRIEPDELLVGNRSSRPIAPPIAAERGDFTFVFRHLFEDLEAFGVVL